MVWTARKVFNTRALVLRSYKLGEADLILVLLSRDLGQVRVVAKGIRKTGSKFGGRLSNFNCVDVQLRESASELKNLVEAQTVHAYGGRICADYDAFVSAEVMAEFTQRLTEEVSNEHLFDLLSGAFSALTNPHHAPGQVLASFLLRALEIEGLQPALESCATCGDDVLRADYVTSDASEVSAPHLLFSIEQGGALCEACAIHGGQKVSPQLIAHLKQLLAGNWQQVYAVPGPVQVQSLDLATRYAQWQLEHKLKSLAFVQAARH